MSREEKTRVEVAVDVLDTEALYAGAVVNTLRVIREAAENSQSEIGEDIGGTCWLLEQVMYEHADTLRAAARGKMRGNWHDEKLGTRRE